MPAKALNQQLDVLCSGCEQVIDRAELAARLKQKSSLTIKIGFDPTAPDLHLGHLVQLNKLKQFQQFGHKVIFLVGDFTARIGDPSGKSQTRPSLTHEQVVANARTYAAQVYRVLDKHNTAIRYNSEWSDHLKPQELIKLMASYSVARLLERDDFATRYQQGDPIALHEFLYPLMQAYDSVALAADVELGGTDQTFNLLAGRKIQRDYGQPSQIVMTLPLLEGLDGTKKMSKSLHNYIAFCDPPDEMFGKLMSLSDTLMWRYWQLLGLGSADQLVAMRRQVAQGLNPRDLKLRLARQLTARLYDDAQAEDAQQAFIDRFSHRQLPKDIPVRRIKTNEEGRAPLPSALRAAGLTAGTSEAMRLIIAGAVRLDEQKITDKTMMLQKGNEHLVQVGKRRIARLILT